MGFWICYVGFFGFVIWMATQDDWWQPTNP